MNLYRLDSKMLQGEHCYLDLGDECYFLDEYDNCRGTGMKAQILALKRGAKFAILFSAQQITSALPISWACHGTFVPMPPSRGAKNAMTLVVEQLRVRDVRRLLIQSQGTPCSHHGWRPTPTQRVGLLSIDELEATPVPEFVVIVDDVLASGSHFRAASMVVRQKWPGMRVIGIFIARVCGRRAVAHGRGECSHYSSCKLRPANTMGGWPTSPAS